MYVDYIQFQKKNAKNCYPSWIILSTLSTSHWSDSSAPSPKGCSSFAVITTDTGNPSCYKPSLHTITLSPLPDRENSDLSTVFTAFLTCLHLHFLGFFKSIYLFILPVVLLLHTHMYIFNIAEWCTHKCLFKFIFCPQVNITSSTVTMYPPEISASSCCLVIVFSAMIKVSFKALGTVITHCWLHNESQGGG